MYFGSYPCLTLYVNYSMPIKKGSAGVFTLTNFPFSSSTCNDDNGKKLFGSIAAI